MLAKATGGGLEGDNTKLSTGRDSHQTLIQDKDLRVDIICYGTMIIKWTLVKHGRYWYVRYTDPKTGRRTIRSTKEGGGVIAYLVAEKMRRVRFPRSSKNGYNVLNDAS